MDRRPECIRHVNLERRFPSRPAKRMGSFGTIPAFLSIDVEPDGFQLPLADSTGWAGYDAMIDFAAKLRTELAECSGVAPSFGWYFRTDPQIEQVYGRADYALAGFSGRTARLEAKGDYLGVHSHAIRWCKERELWVHDFADAAWLAHCTRYSLESFARWAGSAARRLRIGAGFLSNEIIEVADQCGVKVDLSLEPVAGWGLSGSDVETSVDSSPMVGAYTNCRAAPRAPYRPAHHDFRVPDGTAGRNLVMVPLTTTVLHPFRASWKRIARRLLGRSPLEVVCLYPSVEWPSERYYWDLVERELRSMRRPFVSLGLRTDVPDSANVSRIRALFDYLPKHSLAKRLRFVDPLEAAPGLV